MTTAVPLAVPAGGRYGVISGWSAGVVPSAPGAPFAQSGIAGCARATSGRAAGLALAVVVTGAGDDAGVAGALAQPSVAANPNASAETDVRKHRCERVMGAYEYVMMTERDPKPAIAP